MDTIVIVDFGSQYTHLIARQLRKLKIFCIVSEPNTHINFQSCKGIILSGGPNSVYTMSHGKYLQWIIEKSKVPILGICYGMQLLAQTLHGKVGKKGYAEFGTTPICVNDSILFHHIPRLFNVIMSHEDSVQQLPSNIRVNASSKNNSIEGFEKHPYYAIQWHPEVSHSQYGTQLLKNFVLNICHIKPIWDTPHIISQLEQNIQAKVGKHSVLIACSGGVDSTVATVLLYRVIKQQLHGIYVDNGLMQNPIHTWQQLRSLHLPIHKIQAQTIFLHALKNVSNPEQKRKIIGKTFINIFQRYYKEIHYLAQGTIYPDVIESQGKHSHTIKLHHNVGGLPKNFRMKLVEPLRMLFKDEVRDIGRYLGIPQELLSQTPFPGPGLAVRIMGTVTKEKLRITRKANQIFHTILHAHKIEPAQAFTVYLPQKTIGVVGDKRRYGITIALRAIETENFMTAKTSAIPLSVLASVSRTIIQEIPQCARVVYDITDKPPSTIEWE